MLGVANILLEARRENWGNLGRVLLAYGTRGPPPWKDVSKARHRANWVGGHTIAMM